MFGNESNNEEVLKKIDALTAKVKKIESAVAPLQLMNIFNGYSDKGNSFWLEGYLEDIERHDEARRQANGIYLDARNAEEIEYITSASTDDFKPSENTLEKMMMSSSGVVVDIYLRKESDQIRNIFLDCLNKEISIAEARNMAEKIIADRPEGFIYVEYSPESYDLVPEESSLMKDTVKYYEDRLIEEKARWQELKDPEVRKRRLERIKEEIR